jgi:hypothetical protein
MVPPLGAAGAGAVVEGAVLAGGAAASSFFWQAVSEATAITEARIRVLLIIRSLLQVADDYPLTGNTDSGYRTNPDESVWKLKLGRPKRNNPCQGV